MAGDGMDADDTLTQAPRCGFGLVPGGLAYCGKVVGKVGKAQPEAAESCRLP